MSTSRHRVALFFTAFSQRVTTIIALGVFLVSSPLLLGCGLIDSNIADFDLSLPEKEILIDTSTWMLTSDATLPAIDCSNNAGICSAAVSQLCGSDICFGTCNATQECDVKILVSLWHRFDLAQEKPELQQIEGKPLVSITINRIAFKVLENTLNIATPSMSVYVAPEGVMSPGDPDALVIGTLPPIAPGTVMETTDMQLSPEGKNILATFMKQYSKPFNIIVGTDINMHPGDSVPTGMLKAVVVVTATAGI